MSSDYLYGLGWQKSIESTSTQSVNGNAPITIVDQAASSSVDETQNSTPPRSTDAIGRAMLLSAEEDWKVELNRCLQEFSLIRSAVDNSRYKDKEIVCLWRESNALKQYVASRNYSVVN
jgi:hypothetical protein